MKRVVAPQDNFRFVFFHTLKPPTSELRLELQLQLGLELELQLGLELELVSVGIRVGVKRR